MSAAAAAAAATTSVSSQTIDQTLVLSLSQTFALGRVSDQFMVVVTANDLYSASDTLAGRVPPQRICGRQPDCPQWTRMSRVFFRKLPLVGR